MATVDVTAHELPSLPREIVSAIIKCLSSSVNIEDQVFAWTRCRRLSRQIRKEVEDVFSTVHLPKTGFGFDFSGSLIGFDFQQLSVNEDTAIFVPWKCQDRPTQAQVTQSFESLAKTRKSIIIPNHIVWFRNDVNDIEIPYTSLYLEAQKIVVDWKKLFTLYLGEYQLYSKLTRAWVEEHGKPWALESRAQVDCDEIDRGTKLMEALTMAGDAFKDCRKQARRVRVRHQFQDVTGQPLIANKRYLRMEAKVIEQLHEHRFYQSFAESEEDISSQDAESDIGEQVNESDHRVAVTEQEEEYHVTRDDADDYLGWENEMDDTADDDSDIADYSDDSSEDPSARGLPTLEELLAD